MDHSNRKWIVSNNREEYISGVIGFLEFAFKDKEDENVPCPCTKCVNRFDRSRDVMFDHLVINRIMRSYDVWYCHGESLSTSNFNNVNVVEDLGSNSESYGGGDMTRMLGDIFGNSSEVQFMDLEENATTQPNMEGIRGETDNGCHYDEESFMKFMQDVETELYPGCKTHSRLSFLLHLYNIKCRFGWVNKSFDVLLKFFKDVLPEGDNVPKSFQESQKIIEGLGLSYEKIDACPNDCMLFWKEFENAQECHICKSSRWKVEEHSDNPSVSRRNKKKSIPAKVLRYFPLKPRLKRLFMSSKTASDMTWHKTERKDEDGVLRHPADSECWKSFDKKFEEFGIEPRNIRLGLASDGFNPYGRMDSKYSIWPVILIPYNLPPWLCMKKENFILTLLIPGPKAPGNNIDVYLQPLVEELKELWEVGVPTFDASRKEVFQMRAALSWTINDYPALGNLSGWNIYGKFGCSSCNTTYNAERLKYGQKFCFMNHQHFLNEATTSMPPSGEEVLNQLKSINFTLGKENNPPSGVPLHTWKKKSIFFQLPYWEFNLLRHNLDVMHVEKNVCDNVIYTILNDGKKSKDNLKARRDLKHLRIRKTLWPSHRASGKIRLPPACFHLTKEGKNKFLQVLTKVKFPDGYASNIARCVEKRHTLSGLKSHDCHVLMQCLLPIALRGNINDKVASVLVELCALFRVLCGRTLYAKELDVLQLKVPRILCCLEKIFPPSFFTIMVHLVVHLVYEAKVGGPVHYRWMYPIERYLKILKSYVRNKARPEGCIAESYIADECIVFCSRYLKGVYPKNNTRNNAENECEGNDIIDSRLFPFQGRPYGSIEGFKLDEKMWKQAHRYVLFNYEDSNIKSLMKDHVAHIARITRRRRASQHEKDRLHSEGFGDWLSAYVNSPEHISDERLTNKIISLARGPNPIARRFSAFDSSNGCRFRTKEHEKDMSTQNSGVMVVAKTQSYASVSDSRPMFEDVVYYGCVTNMIELDYYGDFKVVLFGCDWVNIVQGRGIMTDGLGCTLVNFDFLIHTGSRINDDPFVLPSQVQQVTYVEDPRKPNWYVPIPMKPRDTYDVGEDEFQDGGVVFVGNESQLAALQNDTTNDIDNLPITNFEEIYADDDNMEGDEEYEDMNLQG